VKVLSVERDRVKLGIEAPDAIKVMRQELFTELHNPAVPDDEPTSAEAPSQGPPVASS
jgi:carbon storage regulator CsrA